MHRNNTTPATGHYEVDSLGGLLAIICANAPHFEAHRATTLGPLNWLGSKLLYLHHLRRANTIEGSRRNIEEHYDAGRRSAHACVRDPCAVAPSWLACWRHCGSPPSHSPCPSAPAAPRARIRHSIPLPGCIPCRRQSFAPCCAPDTAPLANTPRYHTPLAAPAPHAAIY